MAKIVKSFWAVSLCTLLATGAAIAPTAASSKEADLEGKVMPDGEKILCRRVAETGSLVRKSKKCYTRAQWDRIAEAAKANATKMQSDHMSGPAGT
ncbi:MAG: hypothetical protein B7Y44_07675 [Sphingomonadales bacterium 28-55-16]|nr:MAG: hypothetical protein B7Y44_07675 [Sphingomonadales bacterium 28-55-16]